MQSRLVEAEIATFITQIENRGIGDIIRGRSIEAIATKSWRVSLKHNAQPGRRRHT
jgi:hypothetical protein